MERRFRRTPSNTTMKRTEGRESADVPQDLWRKCAGCGRPVYREAARENEYICPRCGAYFRMTAPQRIRQIADVRVISALAGRRRPGSFELPWLCGEAGANTEEDRNLRSCTDRRGEDWRLSCGSCGLRYPVFHGKHGNGDGRADHPRSGAGDRRTSSGCSDLLFWRSSDAGRHPVADADGEDGSGDEAPQ